VNLNAVNSFTGPITLEKGNNVLDAYLSIGGVRTREGNTVGSGSLANGDFPGTIALDARTFLNYNSTATQNLAGAISGAGSVIKTGSGALTLSALNTYTGNTTVSDGDLFLATNSGLSFIVTDSSSNKVTGGGNATFDGSFTIDTSAVSVAAGSWTLVDTTGKTFNSNFSVAGFVDPELDGIWTKADGVKTWSFNEGDGVLSVNSAATITAFGIPGASGVINSNALTIQLYVPAGTNLATLAPTYTITTGTCNQPNDGLTPPTPNFSTGPVHYIVTAGNTVNDYLVTVTESPMILDGLVVWLKADAVNPADTTQVDSSGKVIQWNDSSGTNHNAINTTTGAPFVKAHLDEMHGLLQ
jgi:autotransporter-associated beta strand protein